MLRIGGLKIVSVKIKNSQDIAFYDFEQKSIFIDIDKVIDEIFSMIKSGYLEGINDKVVAFKFFQVIIHEFIHVLQDKMCLNFLDMQVFLEILRDSILFHDGYDLSSLRVPTVADRIKGERLYRKYHDLFPGERHADLTSYNILFSIYKMISLKNDKDLIGFKDLYCDIAGKYYSFGSDYTYPLETFYKSINALKRFEAYDFSIYDAHERFIGGMPLSKKEFNREKSLVLRS